MDGPATGGSCPGGTPTGPFDVRTVTICGATFHHNVAGPTALGGAFFRTVDTTCVPKKTAPVTIDRSTFDANESDGAGALYLHQVDLTLTSSTFTKNIARKGNGGAIWAEGFTGADVTLNLTNVTVTENEAHEGLGGGFVIGTNVGGGEFLHVTVAANAVSTADTGPNAIYKVFAAGLMGDVSKVKLTNSIFANNKKPAPASNDAANCENGFIDGGGNIEFVAPPGQPDPKRCVAGSALVDPALSAVADNGGPTQTIAITTSSPAAKKGTAHCAPKDQRGHDRAAPCAAGAFEP